GQKTPGRRACKRREDVCWIQPRTCSGRRVGGFMVWLRQMFSRRRRYDELSQSISEHLDEKIGDLMDRGMTRGQAEQAARREFGNVTLIEQRSREVWQWLTLESLWAQTKYALRRLRRAPLFTVIALITLAVAVGASTVIFSVVNGVLLKPLSYPNPD